MDTTILLRYLHILLAIMCFVLYLPGGVTASASGGVGSGLDDDSFAWEGGGEDFERSENGFAITDFNFRITLHPPEIKALRVHRLQHVHINCSIPDDLINLHADDINQNVTDFNAHNVTYVFSVMTENADIAVPIGHNYGPESNHSDEIAMTISANANASDYFIVRGKSVGHVLLLIRVTSFLNDWDDLYHTLAILEYRVTVVRKRRVVDETFDWVVAIVACLNVFAIGCATDWASLKMHFKHPTALLLASCCQLLIMPTVGLALAKALGLDPMTGLGLFYAACVPGGGVGHLMVSVIGGDRALSVSINCVCTFVSMGTAPLWIFGMGRFLATPDDYESLFFMAMWLAISTSAYSLGLIIRYASPKAAEAFLTWFAKPFSLLFTLIFITLGVYINMYMFDVLTAPTLMAALLLPALGYAIGTFVSYLSRQESGYVKTIATENTMSNCMLVLVMCKFSLPQPDADIAATLPVWILFMSPLPFILVSIMRRIRRVVVRRLAKQKEKQQRHFSIVSSLLNVTNVTTLSSSMSPKLSSPTSDNNILIDEKVTVL